MAVKRLSGCIADLPRRRRCLELLPLQGTDLSDEEDGSTEALRQRVLFRCLVLYTREALGSSSFKWMTLWENVVQITLSLGEHPRLHGEQEAREARL